jgi:hypothetical protein
MTRRSGWAGQQQSASEPGTSARQAGVEPRVVDLSVIPGFDRDRNDPSGRRLGAESGHVDPQVAGRLTKSADGVRSRTEGFQAFERLRRSISVADQFGDRKRRSGAMQRLKSVLPTSHQATRAGPQAPEARRCGSAGRTRAPREGFTRPSRRSSWASASCSATASMEVQVPADHEVPASFFRIREIRPGCSSVLRADRLPSRTAAWPTALHRSARAHSNSSRASDLTPSRQLAARHFCAAFDRRRRRRNSSTHVIWQASSSTLLPATSRRRCSRAESSWRSAAGEGSPVRLTSCAVKWASRWSWANSSAQRCSTSSRVVRRMRSPRV